MRTALVTGPSSGIGAAVTLELAARGFHVVAAGRSEQRVRAVVEAAVASGGSVEFLHLDLASLDSARAAARSFAGSGRTLDVLVNNAGVGVGRGTTAEGFELQFGVNHLGHFMLTSHLANALRPGSRVVQVASHMHYRSPGIDFDRVTARTRSWLGVEEYATSKLANILFARRLARLRPEWEVYAVHPGVVGTGIFPWYVRPFLGGALTPEQGADTVLWCATDPGATGGSGGYYSDRRERTPSPVAQDDELAQELWARSERWCEVGPPR